MRRRIAFHIRNFFFPPAEASWAVRALPYAVLGVLTLVVLIAGAYAWDYTNSPEFCGTACHTMPPEFTAYLVSPHARVDCVDCHIGRGFIATRITRKAGDVKHIVATAFKTYEFPIRAESLRPARETCEKCHFPQKFSDDSLREIKRFLPDTENTPQSIYLTLKTGGGSKREGLGRGIHWHIENPVLYYALDDHDQVIPYVQVVNEDGSVVEYIDVESDFDPSQIDPSQMEQMDCITCHNRITHLIHPPEDTIDQLMARRQISPEIPEIRRQAEAVYHLDYASIGSAMAGIEGLRAFYQTYYPDFYAANEALVTRAIEALQKAYNNSVFLEQRVDWASHPTNAGHKDSPGCFRCHDGKHLNARQEAIRLECNLCHSVPVVAGPEDFVARIEISRGPEPESHLNPNWIALHHEALDESCSACHTTGNPGGADDSSFCSNSACHGTAWVYAGFDAPALREILADQLAELAPPTPTAPPPAQGGPLTFDTRIGPMLSGKCGSCHGEGGLAGLNLLAYQGLMAGGQSGPVIVPGDPQGSLLVQKQLGETPHFAQLTPQELDQVMAWIKAGAPES